MAHKVIIDTDAGVDDAMALSFAFAHPDIEVIGVTSIFGNVSLEQATANALRLCKANGSSVPVCEGEPTPAHGLPCPSWVHGHDGLGNINLPPLDSVKRDSRGAVEFIAAALADQPGEITLVPIGPLTNLARLVELHPQAVEQARCVVAMGGAAHVIGNVTPLAEFNVAADPEAADAVFGASWPVVMVGLDVTGDTVLTEKNFADITKVNPDLDFLGEAAKKYIDFYTKHVGLAGCCMHDVCAIAYLVEPDILTLADARIRVDCSGLSRGKTAVMPDMMEASLKDWIEKPAWAGEEFPDDLANWFARPRQRYATNIDRERMVDLFVRTLQKNI